MLAAAAGGSRSAAPEVMLATPADGASVLTSAVLGSGPTLGWRIAWGDVPPGGAVVMTIRTATDAALRQNAARGAYRLCITAWDRAGNSARGCAPYRLR